MFQVRFILISWQRVGNPDILKKINLLNGFTMAVTVFQVRFILISWQTVGNPDILKKINHLGFTMVVTVFQASRDGPMLGFGDVSKDLRE